MNPWTKKLLNIPPKSFIGTCLRRTYKSGNPCIQLCHLIEGTLFIFHIYFFFLFHMKSEYIAFSLFLCGLALLAPGIVFVFSDIQALSLIITGGIILCVSIIWFIYLARCSSYHVIPSHSLFVVIVQPPGSATDDCAICLNAKPAETPVAMLSCTHSFHVNCIQTWHQTRLNCPICRI